MDSTTIDWEKIEAFLGGDSSQVLTAQEKAMVELIGDMEKRKSLLGAVAHTDPREAWDRFNENRQLKEQPRWGFVWKVAAVAAAIIGIIVTIGLFFIAPQPDYEGKIVDASVNKVTLILPDKREIVLDTAGSGLQQGTVVISFNKKEAVFEPKGAGASKLEYNTILVPRGKKYQLVLADGSKVWLNADSKLRFPVQFSGNRREVELAGEGYFEVAHVQNQPFVVNYHDQSIRVLGTHFNINAYSGSEAVTLLQGSVEWSGFQKKVLLEPGQQVQIRRAAADKVTTREVQAEDYILWINNTLLLENKTVKNLFEDIARYYNVDIVYKEAIPDSIQFNGAFEFPATIDNMINLINSTGKVLVERKNNSLYVRQP